MNGGSGEPLEIPPAFAETRAYLDRIAHARSVYRRLYAGALGLTGSAAEGAK